MIELTNENFDETINNSKLPVVVDFWATWCGPCKKFTPIIETVAEKYKGRILVAKANVEHNGKAVGDYGIRGIPALIFFREGVELGIEVGTFSQEKVETFINNLFF